MLTWTVTAVAISISREENLHDFHGVRRFCFPLLVQILPGIRSASIKPRFPCKSSLGFDDCISMHFSFLSWWLSHKEGCSILSNCWAVFSLIFVKTLSCINLLYWCVCLILSELKFYSTMPSYFKVLIRYSAIHSITLPSAHPYPHFHSNPHPHPYSHPHLHYLELRGNCLLSEYSLTALVTI